MVNNIFLLAGSVAVAMGGLAFVVLGGDSRADQRRMAIAKTDTKARATTIDRAAKKKQITESLLELEKNSKKKRVDLQTRIEQAGLSIKRQRYLLIFVVMGAVLGGLTYLKSRSPLVAALVARSAPRASDQEVHRQLPLGARYHRPRREGGSAVGRYLADHRQ
jgi:Flp pilus assembly protein TadB